MKSAQIHPLKNAKSLFSKGCLYLEWRVLRIGLSCAEPCHSRRVRSGSGARPSERQLSALAGFHPSRKKLGRVAVSSLLLRKLFARARLEEEEGCGFTDGS